MFVAAIVAAGTLHPGTGQAAAAQAVRETAITMKFWKATVAGVSTIAVTNLPADAIAYEGDTMVFVVKNESPLPEGFSIDSLGVKEVLEPRQTKRIRVANVRAGAHVIYCQLHPFSVHYPGTLLVLPRR
jgi:nitrosocyanin